MNANAVSSKDEYYEYYFRALRSALLIGSFLFLPGYFMFGLFAGIAAGLVGAATGYDRVMDSYRRVVLVRQHKNVQARRSSTQDRDDVSWLYEMGEINNQGPDLNDDFDPRNPSDPFGTRF